jgi:hypothetical protein
MDIVLNGICKRFVSVQKTLAKSTTYRCYPHCPQLPVDNSNLAICLWITFDGGEGVVSVGQSCGSIRPSEKVKMEKGATHHYPAIKKREQRKLPTMPTRLPPTRLRTALDSPAFKVNNPHAC